MNEKDFNQMMNPPKKKGIAYRIGNILGGLLLTMAVILAILAFLTLTKLMIGFLWA